MPHSRRMAPYVGLVAVFLLSLAGGAPCWQANVFAAESHQASSTAPGSTAAGPRDGDRFSTEPARLWKGAADADGWWWQMEFDAPRRVGAILQIVGDGGDVLNNAPHSAVWRSSGDGHTWQTLEETRVTDERRSFRIHRLKQPVVARFLRCDIESAIGTAPALREVEVFDDPQAEIDFPDWVVAVSTTEATEGPRGLGAGREFLPLVRSCRGWQSAPAQFVWMGH
ncbi:MAG: discoidin domain-containing protein, partial [Planctomycetaceae bacterium]